MEGAFVNLHAAEVVLANQYSEQDINSRVPHVLARTRTCLPADDERRIRAETLFGAQANGAAPATTARQRCRNGRSNSRHEVQRLWHGAARFSTAHPGSVNGHPPCPGRTIGSDGRHSSGGHRWLGASDG